MASEAGFQSPDTTVMASAPKTPAAKTDSGKVRRVSIEPADGGFIVNVDRESQPGPGDAMPKPRVAADLAAVHAAIDEMFGGGAPAVEEVAEAAPPMVEESSGSPYAPPAMASGPREPRG